MKFKLLNKWYSKILKGVEGYEGISYEKERLVHSSELHVADLEMIGVKMWKQGQLIMNEVWDLKEENTNGEEIKILIKRYAELLITTDMGKTIWYFGDNSKYYGDTDLVDEILLYIQGKSGSYLVHGNSGDKICYLANIGAGEAFGFMRSLFEVWKNKEGI